MPQAKQLTGQRHGPANRPPQDLRAHSCLQTQPCPPAGQTEAAESCKAPTGPWLALSTSRPPQPSGHPRPLTQVSQELLPPPARDLKRTPGSLGPPARLQGPALPASSPALNLKPWLHLPVGGQQPHSLWDPDSILQ